MAKDIGIKNPILSPSHISQLYDVFIIYADARQRRTDLRDILMTASTLGLDSQFVYPFRLLELIHESTEGHALDFETFVREITNKIVKLI